MKIYLFIAVSFLLFGFESQAMDLKIGQGVTITNTKNLTIEPAVGEGTFATLIGARLVEGTETIELEFVKFFTGYASAEAKHLDSMPSPYFKVTVPSATLSLAEVEGVVISNKGSLVEESNP